MFNPTPFQRPQHGEKPWFSQSPQHPPLALESYSPCSLISDLIQRVVDCVTAIFNAIAGLFSSCFGAQAAAPALPVPQPAYIPLEMIAHAGELDHDARSAAVEDGTRFLLDQIRVLQRADRAHCETLLTNLEVSGDSRLRFAQFLVYYFLSLPSFDQPNDVILDLRRQFAALSEEERTAVLVSLKDEAAYLPAFTAHLLFGAAFVTLRIHTHRTMFFSYCADAAHRALIAEGELIDPAPLVAAGTEFLLHDYKYTDAPRHERLLGRFADVPVDSLHKVIVYHLVFPAIIAAPSDPGRRFLDRLMQTRAARALQGQIADMRATFYNFSGEQQTNALEGWTKGRSPIASTGAFHNALRELTSHFAEIRILEWCAFRVRERLDRMGYYSRNKSI